MRISIKIKFSVFLAVLLLLAFVVINAVEPLRDFFELIILRPQDYAMICAGVVVWAVILRYVWRRRLFERFLGIELN